MKLRYFQLYKIIIYIISILWFIRLGHPTIYISLFLTLIAFFMYITQKEKHKLDCVIVSYVILEITLFIIQIIRLRVYNLSDISFSDLDFLYGEVFLLLLSFPIYEVICVEKESFFKEICYFALIVLVIKALVWYLFNFQNIDLGYFFIGGAERWVRFSLGRLLYRMTGTSLDGFIFAYFITNLFVKNEFKVKLISAMGIIFLFLFALFISQSRVQIIYYSFSIFIGLAYYTWHTKNRELTFIFLFILLVSLSCLMKDKIWNFINSFSLNSNIGDSTQIRLLEYSYFGNLWKNVSWMWGFGMINEPIIINGIAYWLSDLGIADILFQFGIIGFAIGIIPFFIGLKELIKVFKSNVTIINFFFVCMTAYYLISISNINPYRNVNYLTIPFYVAFIMYIINLNKRNI